MFDRFVLKLWIIESDHAVSDLVDGAPVFLGHAYHLTDHLHRKDRGDFFDEVAFTLFDHVIDDAVDDLLHSWLKVGHHARCERLVHGGAILAMPRRIHVDHDLLHARQGVFVGVAQECAVLLG